MKSKIIKILTRVENGKAYLEFDLESPGRQEGHCALIQIFDRDGREVLRSFYPLAEEEPAGGILLHPHLWNGFVNPYLYRVKICFMDSVGKIYESQEKPLALYAMEEIPGKGYFLNGKNFVIKGVRWENAAAIWAKSQEGVAHILELLYRMGANTLYFSRENVVEELVHLCEEKGFWIPYRGAVTDSDGAASDEPDGSAAPDGAASVEPDGSAAPDGAAPVDWDGAAASAPDCNDFFASEPTFLTDIYYGYKARWSSDPFVYISMESIRRKENGTLSLTVYSNQKKVALYGDGMLLEFLTGGPEYSFEEIPIKKYPLTLTAEAGECSMAVTLYEDLPIFGVMSKGNRLSYHVYNKIP